MKTGLGSFGFVMAAQLLAVGAALYLLIQNGRGRRPPLPLREGTLLALAGFWAAAMVVYLMFDRPQFQLAGFDTDYSTRLRDLHRRRRRRAAGSDGPADQAR